MNGWFQKKFQKARSKISKTPFRLSVCVMLRSDDSKKMSLPLEIRRAHAGRTWYITTGGVEINLFTK